MNENDFPLILKVLFVGTAAFGEAGVLLVVAGAVSTVAIPVWATVLKGRWKVSVDAAVSVFDIWPH